MKQKRSRWAAGLAACVVLAACTSNQAAAPRSPTPSESPAAPSFAPPATPLPAQRAEPSLPVAIEETAAAAANGKLYVIGGFNAAGASLDGVYVFDGKAWSAGPRLLLAVDHPAATSLGGSIYIAGGHSFGRDSARVFRLDGDHWSEVASMHAARGGHALVAVEGLLYAIGGNTSQGNVAPVEAFDPATNGWTTVTSLPVPRNHLAGFVLGTRACVAGGRFPTTARVDCFDVVKGTWSRLADLPQATSGGGAATFLGGAVVALGGQDASETRIVPQLTRYDANANTWSAGDTMLGARHGFELAVFQGRAWACGGGSAPGLHPVAACTSIGNGLSSTSNRGK